MSTATKAPPAKKPATGLKTFVVSGVSSLLPQDVYFAAFEVRDVPDEAAARARLAELFLAGLTFTPKGD